MEHSFQYKSVTKKENSYLLKNKKELVWDSQIDSTLWNKSSTLMDIILIKKKEKGKKYIRFTASLKHPQHCKMFLKN